MKRFEDQTHYEVLEVEPGASPEEVRRSFDKLREVFAPGSITLYSLVDQDEQRKLLERLEEAFLVLTDERARTAYDERHGIEAIRRPPPPEPPPRPARIPIPAPQFAAPAVPAPAPQLAAPAPAVPAPAPQLAAPAPAVPAPAPQVVAAAPLAQVAAPQPTAPEPEALAPAPQPEGPAAGADLEPERAPRSTSGPAAGSGEAVPGTPGQGVPPGLPASAPAAAAGPPEITPPPVAAPPAAQPSQLALPAIFPPAGQTPAWPGQRQPAPEQPAQRAPPIAQPPAALPERPAEPIAPNAAPKQPPAAPVAARPAPPPEPPRPQLPPMPEIGPKTEITGELLRLVREARGLGLKEVSTRTRIGANHLENLETEAFDLLPERVYLRGFLTSYARELRLDPNRVCDSYLARWMAARGS